MVRSPCCAKEGLNRGAWTAHEDKLLSNYIKLHGQGSWRNLPKKAGLERCGKSCRLRWMNYLRPDIKRGNISQDEEDLIIRLHKLLGNRWSLIARRLPGRTDNEIKNYWNTNLSKKVKDDQQGSSSASSSLKSCNKNGEPVSYTTKPSPPEVVRVKAAKCTKVLINPQPPKAILVDMNDINGSSSFSNNVDNHENSASDFLVDFELDDISLANLLNSDFPMSDCVEDVIVSNSFENLSRCAGQTEQFFSEEMLQHLDGGCEDADGVQGHPNWLLDFHSLTSFLDGDEGEE